MYRKNNRLILRVKILSKGLKLKLSALKLQNFFPFNITNLGIYNEKIKNAPVMFLHSLKGPVGSNNCYKDRERIHNDFPIEQFFSERYNDKGKHRNDNSNLA